jgi:hypothetical protein
MDRGSQKSSSGSKNYLETKLSRAICVLLTFSKYRYDLNKLAIFIKKNRSYFPEITDAELELLLKANVVDFVDDPEHKEEVPKYAELNSERQKN